MESHSDAQTELFLKVGIIISTHHIPSCPGIGSPPSMPTRRWREGGKENHPKELGKGKALVNPHVSWEAALAAARNTNVVSVW